MLYFFFCYEVERVFKEGLNRLELLKCIILKSKNVDVYDKEISC